VAVLTTAVDDTRTARRSRKLEKARLDLLEARMRVRLAAEALGTLERALESSSTRADRSSPSERELRAARADFERERKRLAHKEARARAHQREAREGEPRQGRRTYRLQSSRHQLEWSEKKFERLSIAQRREPVLVTSTGGRRWWWFRDRFWWDDQVLRADEVKAWVLEHDFEALQRRQLTDSLLAAVWQVQADDSSARQISDEIRKEVWARQEGCCADCGSLQAQVFSLIRPIEEGGSYISPNVELRCTSCEARRRDNEGRARVERAHFDAHGGDYPDKLKRIAGRRDTDLP
jgi:hypothetical protein